MLNRTNAAMGCPGTDDPMVSDYFAMTMSFYFGYDLVVLFDQWQITTIGNLIGSMIGIFIIAFLYEGLRFLREHLQTEVFKPPRGQPTRMLSLGHLVQTVLHIIQVTVSYLLMLIFMTYNVWCCIAVVTGAAAGYFVFNWRKPLASNVTEHCH